MGHVVASLPWARAPARRAPMSSHAMRHRRPTRDATPRGSWRASGVTSADFS